MYEFRVPEDDHIDIPTPPSILFSLAIGILGDAAAWIADGEVDPEPNPNDGPLDWLIDEDARRDGSRRSLGFAATFFDAFLASQFDPEITDEFSLLCSAAYYLAGTPGNSRVVISNTPAPSVDLERGLPRLVHAILSDQLAPLELVGAYAAHINAVLAGLRTFFAVETAEEDARDACRELRALAYGGGTARELLYADITAALCLLRIKNAARTILPASSDLGLDQWRDALRKGHFPKELWPAQQRICVAGMLRGASAVVQMPTSAGKTRATELIIRSSFLSERTDLAVVVAPFRSLCHDIRSDLSKAFLGENVSISEATDSYQNDLALADLFGSQTVLIVTPEKLLYLLRRTPELGQLIGLIIYDEGHQFEGMTRGPTYELLLTSLKLTLPPKAQVVLISAVIGNAPTVARWLLGDENAVVGGQGLIPTTKSIAFASWQDARGRLEYVAPDDPNRREFFVPRVIERTELQLRGRERNPQYFPKDSGTDVGLYLGLFVVANGSVAVFCGRKDTAAKLCERLAYIIERGVEFPLPVEVSDADEIAKIAGLFGAQLGPDSNAAKAAAMGVLAHHANVPHGLRLSIEHAMKEGLARFVVCTSTLAQGVNFPIKYLIITGVQQGQDRILVRDFHNLMGRAGRAGMHTEGSIIFSSPDVYDGKGTTRGGWRWREARKLLDPANAEDCSSSLLELFSDYLQSDPPIVLELSAAVLPQLTFADAAAIEALVVERLAINQNLSTKEFRGFLNERARAIQSIAAFLLAHGSFDEDGAVDRAEALAKNTLAFELADEPTKAGLVVVFRGVAQALLDNGDADLRAVIRRSPLPPSAIFSLQGWISAQGENLAKAVAEGTINDLVIPAILSHVTSSTIRSLSSQDNVPTALRQWISGDEFVAIHHPLRAAGLRVSNRGLKVEDVVAMCESGFGYDAAMVIASLADLLEGGNSDVQRAVAFLQRQVKAGLGTSAALAFYEIGFTDRTVAKALATAFPFVTDRQSARATLRTNRAAASAVLLQFPSYFGTVFSELVGV
ncbi:MAG: DEAD/DEAH box helicase [Phenylobacterium sp.]|jgi:hypothetical protein|nr:DEAD/DEAH box helicase [Phenylobacterium sp.]